MLRMICCFLLSAAEQASEESIFIAREQCACSQAKWNSMQIIFVWFMFQQFVIKVGTNLTKKTA